VENPIDSNNKIGGTLGFIDWIWLKLVGICDFGKNNSEFQISFKLYFSIPSIVNFYLQILILINAFQYFMLDIL
jgi:hypothetical protein